MTTSRLCQAAVLIALLCAGTAAQEPSPSKRAGATVAVEFFANGPDGLVYDLRAEEVVLRVEGRPRDIRSLRFVSLPVRDPLAAGTAVSRDLDVPFGSNLPESPGRWVSLIVDHESIRAGA